MYLISDYLLIFFLALSILCALVVIRAKDPIVSIIFLVLVFVCSSGFLITLGVEFLALLFILVYVGAVAVLFLFIIMMLNLKILRKTRFNYFIDTLVFFFFLIICIVTDILYNLNFSKFDLSFSMVNYIEWTLYIESATNLGLIGEAMYINYFLLFILSAFILLVAMIGPIVLTLRKRQNAKAIQSVYHQNLYSWKDNLSSNNYLNLKS